MNRTVLASLIVLSAFTVVPAQARDAASLKDLVGARGSSGQSALESRGFTFYSSAKAGPDSVASLYVNRKDGNCVKVVTKNGRYVTIVDTAATMCGIGGHAHPAHIDDLVGMDGVRSFDVMQERGFTNVDTLTSGNDVIGIYWNGATHQCIQVITANSKVNSATDIHTHPKCR